MKEKLEKAYVWVCADLKKDIDQKIGEEKAIDYMQRSYSPSEIELMKTMEVYVLHGHKGICVASPSEKRNQQLLKEMGKESFQKTAWNLFNRMLENYVGIDKNTKTNIHNVVIYDGSYKRLRDMVIHAIDKNKDIDRKQLDDTVEHYRPLAEILRAFS